MGRKGKDRVRKKGGGWGKLEGNADGCWNCFRMMDEVRMRRWWRRRRRRKRSGIADSRWFPKSLPMVSRRSSDVLPTVSRCFHDAFTAVRPVGSPAGRPVRPAAPPGGRFRYYQTTLHTYRTAFQQSSIQKTRMIDFKFMSVWFLLIWLFFVVAVAVVVVVFPTLNENFACYLPSVKLLTDARRLLVRHQLSFQPSWFEIFFSLFDRFEAIISWWHADGMQCADPPFSPDKRRISSIEIGLDIRPGVAMLSDVRYSSSRQLWPLPSSLPGPIDHFPPQ